MYLPSSGREVILTNCKALLEKTAECQQDLDAEDDVDQSEYDSVVISTAVDVIAAIANVLGAHFVNEFSVFLPLITKYYVGVHLGYIFPPVSDDISQIQDPKRSNTERSMTIGSLGEIIVGLERGVTQFTEPILAVLSRALADSEADVRSNAAFAAGAMIEWSDVDLTSQYVPLLGALQPYFIVDSKASKDSLNAKDNAAGAVARMIVKSADSLPLPGVLPIFIGALPLKNDTVENRAVFDAIFHLFETRPDAIMPFVDQLLPVFAYVLDPSRTDELITTTRERLVQLVVALQQQMPDKVAAAGLK
jgi:importin-4